MQSVITVFALLFVTNSFAAPSTLNLIDSLFVSSTEPSTPNNDLASDKLSNFAQIPQIYEMHVQSSISNRFARTTVRSKVRNYSNKTQETTFSLILPESAFISEFTMEVGGKNYTAYVKEKEEAKKTYDEAVASGLGAAHVELSARDSNRFTVNVNVEPETKAAFYLSYEELLKRQVGHYELVINLHPGQPVEDLSVEVNIEESRKIVDLNVPPIRSGNDVLNTIDELYSRADIQIVNETSAVVRFSPNIERQKQLAHYLGTKEDNGLAGQFVVTYDVERDPHGGEVLIQDGYFVHFFSPSSLKPIPKHVVFVLDTSSSMYGQRIKQLIEAMDKILGQLNKKDLFHLVEFNTNVRVWDLDNSNSSVWYPVSNYDYNWEPSTTEKNLKEYTFPDAYPATIGNIDKAKATVHEFAAVDATDIHTALEVGLHLIELTQTKTTEYQPMIIFLTDGEPTVRITSTQQIIDRMTELNSGSSKTPIFALSFGDGADRDFLQKLSLRNYGFSKHIYEGADASLQLENFYKQISSPLLSNVTFKYQPSATSLTRTDFPILFDGSEIVVAGWCGVVDAGFEPGTVKAWNGEERISFKPVIKVSISSVERLWAYLTVKQLLDKKEISDTDREQYEKQALELSLKYSFVTPVSSLVVVKPNDTDAVNTQVADIKPSVDTDTRFGGIPLSMGWGMAESMLDEDFVDMPDIQLTIVSTQPPVIDTTSTISLLDVLPWLNDAINEQGLLKLPTGEYDLGLNATITDDVSCSNAPLKNEGHCRLITACPHVFSVLTGLEVLVDHFCVLQPNFAGICCPDMELSPIEQPLSNQ